MFKYYKYFLKHTKDLQSDETLCDGIVEAYNTQFEGTDKTRLNSIVNPSIPLDMFKGTLFYKTRKYWVPVVTIGDKIYNIYWNIKRWWMLRGIKPADFVSDGLINTMTSTRTPEMDENAARSSALITSFKK